MDIARVKRHEAFMSNLTGGSIFQPYAILLNECFFFVYCTMFSPRFSGKLNWRNLIYDVIGLCLCFILLITVFNAYQFELLLVNTAIYTLILWFRLQPTAPPRTSLAAVRRGFRALTMLCTCVCIYAVDFPVFPRRFAKPELHGVSLMDVGVGLIALSIGSSCGGGRVGYTSPRFLRSLLPVIVIGFVRLLVTKIIGYPEHVTEYGVHWNFFFTIAAMQMFGFLLSAGLRHVAERNLLQVLLVTSVALSLTQHFILSPIGLDLEARLVLSGPDALLTQAGRASSVFLANAEGIISLPGYFALYAWGATMTHLLSLSLGYGNKTLKLVSIQMKTSWVPNKKRIVGMFVLLTVMAFCVTASYGAGAVSRRLVNLPFITLQVSLGCQVTAMLLVATDIPRGNQATKTTTDFIAIFKLISDSSLAYFLLSNLAVGLLNLCFDPLDLAQIKPASFAYFLQLVIISVYSVGCLAITPYVQSLLVQVYGSYAKQRLPSTKE